MSKKALLYTRKNGDRVLVLGGTIAGQLRFVPMKRTALDGKEWWCVYDNERGDWTNSTVLGGARWKMKIECARAIAKAIEKHEIPFEPYDEGSQFKSGKHKFVVEVHWDVARSYEVEAKSREEAQAIIQKRVDEGEVCVWTDGFEATDDVEVECHGEELKGGAGIQYF